MAGLDYPVPGFASLWHRQKTLAVQIPYRRADGPLNLLVPSRPISAQSPAGNKCPARKHGPQGWHQ
jgi:hypothetical protein